MMFLPNDLYFPQTDPQVLQREELWGWSQGVPTHLTGFTSVEVFE